jgi:O-antigen ligase/tetratricopeptide (TPR) repeat protein
VLLAFLYLVLVDALRIASIERRLSVAVAGLAIGIPVVYVAQALNFWMSWWEALGFVTVPPLRPRAEGLMFSNPSAVMAVSVLLTCSVVGFFGFRGRAAKVSLVVIGLAVATSLLSGSRGGFVGLGVATLSTGLVALSLEGRHRLRTILPTARWRLVVGAGIGSVALVLTIFLPSILSRIGEAGGDLRVGYVMAAGRQFVRSPLVGEGPGMWVVRRMANSESTDGDRYVPHAHNFIAQSLAETGLLGIAVGLLVAFLFARMLIRTARGPDAVGRRWVYPAVFAITYFLGHQLADMFVNLPAVMLAAVLPIAVVDSRTGGVTPIPKLAKVAGLIGALILALGVPELVARELHAGSLARETQAWNEGRWSGTDAVRPSEPTGVALFDAGLQAAHQGSAQDAALRFEAAARLDDFPATWLNLAAIQTHIGNSTEARKSLASAMRLGRQHPSIALAAGDLYLQLRDEEAAIDAYASAVTTMPALLLDVSWTQEPYVELLPRVVRRAMETAPTATRWRIPLELGEYDTAREAAASAGGWAPALVDAAADPLHWQERLQALIDASPADPLLADAVIRVAELRGAPVEADRIRKLVSTYSRFAAGLGRSIRIDRHGPPSGQLADDSMGFYGEFTYRRATPIDLLVPGLPRILWSVPAVGD